jgi:hypothetical protein
LERTVASVPTGPVHTETGRIVGTASPHVETNTVVRTMKTTFWLLETPRNQRLATLADNTKFEQITCSASELHLHAGRRLGDLGVTIDPAGIKDFTWTWPHNILVSERLLDLFLRHRVTGYEIRPATLSYSKRSPSKPPPMYELIVTGWGGIAAPGAGLKLAKWCPTCNHKIYSIAVPSRLIDPEAWDGSDLFIVWPLPRYRFVSDRLANILREERMTGVKLIPATEIPFEPGNHASPGRLLDWMPAKHAHALGDGLGIN